MVVYSHTLWLVVVSLSLLGLGFGTLCVTFHVIAEATLCVNTRYMTMRPQTPLLAASPIAKATI